jgi:hypothetical protein
MKERLAAIIGRLCTEIKEKWLRSRRVEHIHYWFPLAAFALFLSFMWFSRGVSCDDMSCNVTSGKPFVIYILLSFLYVYLTERYVVLRKDLPIRIEYKGEILTLDEYRKRKEREKAEKKMWPKKK